MAARFEPLTETITVTGESPRIQTSRAGRRDRGNGQGPGVAAGIAGGVAPIAAPDSATFVSRPSRVADDHIEDNSFHRVATDPLSTFSIADDIAAYANVRRWRAAGS